MSDTVKWPENGLLLSEKREKLHYPRAPPASPTYPAVAVRKRSACATPSGDTGVADQRRRPPRGKCAPPRYG